MPGMPSPHTRNGIDFARTDRTYSAFHSSNSASTLSRVCLFLPASPAACKIEVSVGNLVTGRLTDHEGSRRHGESCSRHLSASRSPRRECNRGRHNLKRIAPVGTFDANCGKSAIDTAKPLLMKNYDGPVRA
jgi:hypothetical protein